MKRTLGIPLDRCGIPRYVYSQHRVRQPEKTPRSDAVKIEIPTNPSARWEWIKYQIRSRGLSFAELSRRMDVELGTLTSVKRHPYPRMERALASAIGLSPATIWPERWNADGTPHRQRPNRAESRVMSQKTCFKTHCADSNAPSTAAHRQVVTEA